MKLLGDGLYWALQFPPIEISLYICIVSELNAVRGWQIASHEWLPFAEVVIPSGSVVLPFPNSNCLVRAYHFIEMLYVTDLNAWWASAGVLNRIIVITSECLAFFELAERYDVWFGIVANSSHFHFFTCQCIAINYQFQFDNMVAAKGIAFF